MEEPTALTQADNQQQQNLRSPLLAKLPAELRLRIYNDVLGAPCALKISEHTQHDGVEGGEGVYNEGYMNGLRERITELLVLNFGDRKKIMEVVDEFRCSVVAAKNRDASFARILEREQRLQELRAQAKNSQRLDYARARSAGYLAPGW